ncbi:MAG: LysM peptidoglycan-binding domain-containing protein [Gemmatimonadetes bacterium]|nr:LysM peptidoglycan-binding domain-containing protein [Gemmatimonadota bacterium]
MSSKRAPATLVGALLAFSACSPVRPAPTPAPAIQSAALSIPEPDLLGDVLELDRKVAAPRRDILGSATYDLPMEANSWVEAELDFLVGQRREVIGRWLERGDYYSAFIQGVFRAAGVPTDLYHLAMIESAFVPTARSRVGAVGFWQFMPATAKAVGLRVDSIVDERMDPVRSTRAAVRHLRALRRELGDWSLAAAAYNAGSGRITRGMRAYGAKDFWELAERGDLAAETKQYVPRLYAVTVIGRDRERFGFRSATAPGFSFDSINVEYATPLSELAKLGGASAEALAQLNPHLVSRTTPAGSYWVWVPAGRGVALQRAWLASDFRKEQGFGSYAIRKGDTLGKLAELAELRSARIVELNPDVDFDDLQIGEKLRLPFRIAQTLSSRPVRREIEEQPRSATREGDTTHSVKPGETLSRIARDRGVSVAELQRVNELDGTSIRAGQELRIPVVRTASVTPKAVEKAAGAKEHVVKSGDSLWTIAHLYGSSVSAIQTANRLGERPIQPGQKLTIPVLN